MKLTASQLRSIVKGTSVITENADGTLGLQRMTEEHIAFYPIHDPAREFSCRLAAGIQLDFYTDSTTLNLTVSGRRKKKSDSMVVDVLENNVLAQSVTCYFPAEASGEVTQIPARTLRFSLSEGEKRVTLCFARGASVDSFSLELDDGASFRPYTHARTLVALGDSITFGASAVNPSLSYVNRLGRMLDAEVHNYGIGGERFEEWKVLKGSYPKCDLVTVSYGTNDFGHKVWSDEKFSYKMPAFLKAVSEEFASVPVFILLPLWRADENDVKNDLGILQNVRDRIAKEAQKYANLTVVDTWDFIPHEPKYFADLKLHPNNEGMEFYAAGLFEAIKNKI